MGRQQTSADSRKQELTGRALKEKVSMVGSQFAALETPAGALTIDIRTQRPPEIIVAIRRQLR